MIDFRKGALIVLLTFVTIGCSDPEPQVIDMDELAVEAGLSEDDYVVHENGAIEVKGSESVAVANDQPLAVQGGNWKYVISNALMIADAHAVANNPAATYIPQNSDINLIKQMGGQYEGEHLLTVVNDNNGDISYVQLRPLFDVNESSDLLEEQLDDETPLWEVTVAKYNGQEF